MPSEFYAVHAVLQSGYEYDQLWVRFEHGGKEINQQDRGSMAGSVEELAARHREYRAKEQDERAAQLARYIANQNAVVDGWKPFDLVPVK